MAFSCKAQQTIPLDKEWEYVKSLPEGEFTPEGTYFKDINGVLDQYLGAWSGTFDRYQYEFIIYREKYDFYGIYEDVLFVDYKIEGNKIIKGVIKGKGYKEGINSPYILFYTGLDDNDVFCGDKGTIYLDIAQDGKTMKLFIIPSEALISEEECPQGGINPPFPDETKTPMILIQKQ